MPRFSLLIMLLSSLPALAATTVVDVGPTATTREVRQVRMRFSDDMVALGDSRADDPAAVGCSDPGLQAVGHWIDARNWVGEFARVLPDGVTCTVRPRPASAQDGEREEECCCGATPWASLSKARRPEEF